jgi:galactose mutarotase-like enzyme
MKDEQSQIASTADQSARTWRYTAEVDRDPELQTTMLALSAADQRNPSRNTRVCIAPEYGSNLYRFRVGEQELIYTDQLLLKRRDFTGSFVLWPFPNRVRDKRYTYQERQYSLEQVHRPGGDPTLIHGLVFDQPWHYTQPVIGKDGVSVTTYIDFNAESPNFRAYPLRAACP